MYQRQCAHLQHLFFSFFTITKQFLAKPMTAQNRVYFSVSLQLSIFMWPNSRQQDYTWRVLWLFSCSVVSSSLWPHEPLQHVKFPVLHHLHEFAQTHAHWVDDAIQPSHSFLGNNKLAPLSFNFFLHLSVTWKAIWAPEGFVKQSCPPWITYLWNFMWKRTTSLSCLSCCCIKFVHYSRL